MPKRAQGLYVVLEKRLKAAKQPLTCVELWDFQDVKDHAESSNRVSDYLGHLWRKGLARRIPAPKTRNNEARYAYTWNWGNEVSLSSGTKLRNPPTEEEVVTIFKRTDVEITERGKAIVITLPKMIITIRDTS